MIVKPASLIVIGLSLCFAHSAIAQTEDEPIGWPYRPKAQEPKTPMPVPTVPSAKPDRKTDDTAIDNIDKPPLTRPDADIAPIERIRLPVRPLDFIYDDARIALNRDEVQKLTRLAERLRGNHDRLHIVSYGPGQTPSPRQSLEAALTRALHIRSFLVHEGIALSRIDLDARPHKHPGNKARPLYGHVHIEASSREKDILSK